MSERVFLHEAWTDIATEYSKRKLTFVEDRFLAIAAVAKHIQRKAHPFLRPLNESNKPPRATNDKSLGAGGWAQLLQMAQDFWETTKAIDEHMIARYNISYYAGCWSHLFIEHLCWQRKYDLNQHPPAWQLVTWSWISVGSEVEFMIKPGDFPEVEILDYSITSQPNNDPFSNMTTTELKICGHILPINGYSYHTLFGSFCTNISLDLTAETWSNDMSADQQRRESYSRTFVQKTFGDDEAKYVFLLNWTRSLPSALPCCGLILNECAQGQFTRIGFLSFPLSMGVDAHKSWSVSVKAIPKQDILIR